MDESNTDGIIKYNTVCRSHSAVESLIKRQPVAIHTNVEMRRALHVAG